jgi:uncharacterized membrane protein YqjE
MNSTHASSANRAAASSVSSKLALAWSSMRALVQDHAVLALLEVQRAGISLVKMIAAAIIISMLAITAWTGIVAAAVVWAVDAGANWAIAIFLAALANIALAVGLGFWAKKQVPDVLFAATMRQLRKDVPRTENEHAPNRTVA